MEDARVLTRLNELRDSWLMFTCTTCGEAKPTEMFWKQNNKRGHMAECKQCSTSRTRTWIGSNKERYRELNLEATHRYRKKDPRLWLIYAARARARKKGIDFDLTPEDLEWPENCPVLGIPLTSLLGTGKGRRLDNSPSLDRIDNTKGYVKGNVVVVSWRANRIKVDATPEELMKVAEFYARR